MAGHAVSHRWGPADQQKLLAALRKPRSVSRRAAPIDLHSIITLNQPRKTFDGIPELAESIALQGLIHAPTVGLLTREEFKQYVAITDRLWNTMTDWRDFRPTTTDAKPMYPVLIAGERRLRACRHLWEVGCSACNGSGHPTTNGRCFRRHFEGTRLDVTIHRGISAVAALNLQYSENTHHPVPVHQEAEAYYLFFRLLRDVMPTLTVAAFARQVGRSADWVHRALAFCDASREIQDAVRAGHIAYSVALELHRLEIAGFTPTEVEYRLRYLIVNGQGTKSHDFRRQVTGLIVNRRSMQGGLFEIMSAQQEKASWRAAFRRSLGGNFLGALRGAIEYLLLVVKAITLDELGRVYALGSVRKNLERLVTLLEQINDHRQRILTKKWADRLRKAAAHHRTLSIAERKKRRRPRS